MIKRRCCSSDCFAFECDEDKPCWGNIEAIDEVNHGDGDWGWVHACTGHAPVWNGESYLREYDAGRPRC